MTDHYTINLANGKYTVISEFGKPLTFLRYAEPWPGADGLKYAGVVLAMAQRIEELEVAIRAVLDGTVDAPDGVMHGLKQLRHYPETMAVLAPRWIALLCNVLDQK